MARKKEIDKDRILDAADAVILESGGRFFTLDAVAERAGISKGGLVYSFPTKDALVAAALEREMSRFSTAVRARAESDGGDSRRQLLAHVEQALAENDSLSRQAAFLMVALVHAPDMVGPARTFYSHLFKQFEPDTLRGREIRQAVLAMEGLFLLRGLGFVDVQAEEWESVLKHACETIIGNY
ncbi:TetR family transcriptional regulator [Pseudochelatococcus contaminans]|uniref:AcrR family transcriptional regulator n=1 Tax=Pseudochelatococcus contaminans TaxID=1538103 RepID=A0A7W6EG86_9HYPH|nr:AcrR family transcriptional regulator [Pseudochelatococcus contaminans]